MIVAVGTPLVLKMGTSHFMEALLCQPSREKQNTSVRITRAVSLQTCLMAWGYICADHSFLVWSWQILCDRQSGNASTKRWIVAISNSEVTLVREHAALKTTLGQTKNSADGYEVMDHMWYYVVKMASFSNTSWSGSSNWNKISCNCALVAYKFPYSRYNPQNAWNDQVQTKPVIVREKNER